MEQYFARKIIKKWNPSKLRLRLPKSSLKDLQRLSGYDSKMAFPPLAKSSYDSFMVFFKMSYM